MFCSVYISITYTTTRFKKKKTLLFSKTKQYNIKYFDKNIFLCRFYKAAVAIKISSLGLIYLFVSVALICLVLYLNIIFLSKICIMFCLIKQI